MAQTFNVLVEQDEDGWFISEVLELSGCHTQAKTLDELMERTKEAISLCLKSARNGRAHERFVGLQQLVV